MDAPVLRSIDSIPIPGEWQTVPGQAVRDWLMDALHTRRGMPGHRVSRASLSRRLASISDDPVGIMSICGYTVQRTDVPACLRSGAWLGRGYNAPMGRMSPERRHGFVSTVAVVAVAFAFGIVAGEYVLPIVLAGVLGAVGAALSVVLVRAGRHRGAVALLALAAVGVGAFHLHVHNARLARLDVFAPATPDGAVVTVQGVIADFPSRRRATWPGQGERTSATVRIDHVLVGDRWEPVRARTLLSAYGLAERLERGDRIEASGRLRRIAPPRSPGEYGFQKHYARRGIFTRLYVKQGAHVRVTGKRREGPLPSLAAFVRRRAREAAPAALGPGAVDTQLLLCLVCGDRRAVEPETRDILVRAGVYHFFVVSGLHVGIVAGAILLIVRLTGAGDGAGAIVTAVGTLVYVAITGFHAPAVRALVMLLAWLARLLLGRRGSAWDALALAALVLLVMDPNQVFDTGFQLSFIAVVFILLFTRPLTWRLTTWVAWPFERPETVDEHRWRYGIIRFLCGLVAVSLAAWLGVWVLLARGFHVVTPISIVSNLVFLPLVLAGMIVGFPYLVLAVIAPGAAAAPAWLAAKLMALTYAIAKGVASLDVLWFHVATIPLWLVLGYYAGVWAVVWARRFRPLARWATRAAVASLFVAALLITQSPRKGFSLNVLDVGHGLCVAVLTDDGKTLVYDCGGGSGRFAADRLSALLWQNGRRRIDALVLSHPDRDHTGGVTALLERFAVERVLVGPGFARDERTVPLLVEQGTPCEIVHGTTRLAVGDTTFEIGGPEGDVRELSDNDTSLWLAFTYGDQRFLVLGDQERRGIEMLLAERPGTCDVLVLPHHGRDAEMMRALLEATRPRIALASTSGGPHPFTRALLDERRIDVHPTSDAGTLRVEVRNHGVAVARMSP